MHSHIDLYPPSNFTWHLPIGCPYVRRTYGKNARVRRYHRIIITKFCRRDSFITHRAFCDALAEESARAITTNPLVTQHPVLFPAPAPPINPAETNQDFQDQLVALKKETQNPAFSLRQEIPSWLSTQAINTTSPLNYHDIPFSLYATRISQENGIPHHLISTPAPHMSATALLQKAAQMGAISSSSQQESMSLHGSTSQNSFIQDLMVKSMPQGTVFDDNARREEGRNGNDGLTRDFLGLRPISHRDLLSLAGIETCITTSYENQKKKSWLGN